MKTSRISSRPRGRRVGLVLLLVLLTALLSVGATLYFSHRLPSREVLYSDGSLRFSLPEYTGEDCVVLNGDRPYFSIQKAPAASFVLFSPLDSLGRTGPGFACLGPETLPTEERGPIGNIRPSGWQTVRYDDLIEDLYLYNRSHVIGFLLCGDNATPENLFTGTRHLNHDTMLPYEIRVKNFILSTGQHVLYRVTPVYRGSDLVATGVLMEAMSVEDGGAGLSYCVFIFNVQPGVRIDYATGESVRTAPAPTGAADASAPAELPLYESAAPADGTEATVLPAEGSPASDGLTPERTLPADLDPDPASNTAPASELPVSEPLPAAVLPAGETPASQPADEGSPSEGGTGDASASLSLTDPSVTYVLNIKTLRFHLPGCQSVQEAKPKNLRAFTGTRDEALAEGFTPCGRCHP